MKNEKDFLKFLNFFVRDFRRDVISIEFGCYFGDEGFINLEVVFKDRARSMEAIVAPLIVSLFKPHRVDWNKGEGLMRAHFYISLDNIEEAKKIYNSVGYDF